MKLLVMKLVCLAVALASVFMLGLIFDLAPVQQAFETVLDRWPRQECGALNLRLPGLIAGLAGLAVGLYGLLPRLSLGRRQTITFKSTHGDVVLQLAPIRRVLLKMMRGMPEVHHICLEVKPSADRRHACIEAAVVLRNCAEQGARHTARLISDCIAAGARETLGLEEICNIRLTITGIHVDAIGAGKQVRERVLQRHEDEVAAYTAALARPPMASVTLDESAISPLADEPPAAVAADAEDRPCPSEAAPCPSETESLPEENEAMPLAQSLSPETEETPEAQSEPATADEPRAEEKDRW